LSCHAAAEPYGDQRGKIADRIEMFALQTRFATFFTMNLILILNGPFLLNCACAAVVLGMNGCLILGTALVIISETVGATRRRQVVPSAATQTRKTRAERMRRFFEKLSSWVVDCLGAL